MAKFVMLTPARYGKYAIVDDDDFDRVMQHHWTYGVNTNRVCMWVSGRTLPLANFILGVPIGTVVDHRDRNPLNNTRTNLRVATRSQNASNTTMRRRSNSGYRGVHKYGDRYQARIKLNNKTINLGMYATAREAAIVRDNAARELHGEFAVLNFPGEDGTP
jgi:hypothetical protein